MKAMSKKKLTVHVRTIENGYTLDVDGKGYLYFNTHSLVEGFLMHVGMKRMTAMTQEQTSAMLEALQDGSAVKMLQAEVTELKARIIELKNMIRTQRNTIKELKK